MRNNDKQPALNHKPFRVAHHPYTVTSQSSIAPAAVHTSHLPLPPDFAHYQGEYAFTLENTVYQHEKVLGAGSFGSISLFSAPTLPKEHPQKFLAVKAERQIKRQTRSPEDICFPIEAEWNRKIHGFGKFSGNPRSRKPHYLAMLFFHGVTMRNVAAKTFIELIEIYMLILTCIARMHSNHLAVHCDIKNDNIIFGNDGKVYPIDFGATRHIGEEVPAYSPPKNGKIAEYFPHIPPELFFMEAQHKKNSAHPQHDIYALAYLLIQLIMTRHAAFDIPALEKRKEHAKGSSFALRCRASNPVDRPQTLSHMIYLFRESFLSPVPRLPMQERPQNPLEPLISRSVMEIIESNDVSNKENIVAKFATL